MKINISIVIAALFICAALRAEVPSVQFAGVKYQLASVEVSKDGSITNEYVPLGETIDSWSTLLAVRHWPKAKKISDASGPWLKMISPLLTQKIRGFQANSAKSDDDIIFEAWLSAPDRSYIEVDLHRFVIEQGTNGVKAYQFAQKIVMTDGQGNPTSFIKNRDALIVGIGKLQLPALKKKE